MEDEEMIFYILEKPYTKNMELPHGPRIISMKHPNDNIYFRLEKGDGPFLSLEELRRESPIYKKLLNDDQKRALKICQDEFIEKIVDRIIIPMNLDKSLNGNMYHALDHTISGIIGKKSVSGIHYFDSRFHRVIKITKERNSKGIWEGKVEALRPKTDKWIVKRSLSTFFPREWTKEYLCFMIAEAYHNKTQFSENLYKGQTSSGVEINFIIKKDRITSIYPTY